MINFQDWMKARDEEMNEALTGPNIPQTQQIQVWKNIYSRALPNEKYVLGSFLWNNDNQLYSKITGQQTAPQYQNNPQPTNV